MSSTDFVEYAMGMMRQEDPHLSEETIAYSALYLVEKARKEVRKRETLRITKATNRGIDLSNKTIVSTEAYNWYMNLSPSEHVEQLGFNRKHSKINNSANESHDYRKDKNVGSVPLRTVDRSNSIIKNPTFHNSSGNTASRIQKNPNRFYGKENRVYHWPKSGNNYCGRNQNPWGNYSRKRKCEEMMNFALKRQRTF